MATLIFLKFFTLSDCAKVIKDYNVVLKKWYLEKGRQKKFVVYLEKGLFAKALMCEYFTPNDDDAKGTGNEGNSSLVPK